MEEIRASLGIFQLQCLRGLIQPEKYVTKVGPFSNSKLGEAMQSPEKHTVPHGRRRG